MALLSEPQSASTASATLQPGSTDDVPNFQIREHEGEVNCGVGEGWVGGLEEGDTFLLHGCGSGSWSRFLKWHRNKMQRPDPSNLCPPTKKSSDFAHLPHFSLPGCLAAWLSSVAQIPLALRITKSSSSVDSLTPFLPFFWCLFQRPALGAKRLTKCVKRFNL